VTHFRLALCQIPLAVGDVTANATRVREALAAARQAGAHLALFPELTLTGYPPEDLLYHAGLRDLVERELAALAHEARGIAVAIGHPEYAGKRIHNALSLLSDGRIRAIYRKRLLPNYRMFDEQRYFQPGDTPTVVEVAGVRVGLTICEDLWHPGPAADTARAGAELIINASASPYEMGKPARRETVFAARVAECALPIATVNALAGQDELVFDGASFVLDATGQPQARLAESAPDFQVVEFERTPAGWVPRGTLAPRLDTEASAYGAIQLGIRDYVTRNGFQGAVLGLSGGIDSALVLALAVDALGADQVSAVMMPSRHTSELSLAGAEREARLLGVDYRIIPIEGPYQALLEALAPSFAGRAPDTTEENLQARVRGNLLMALSNKTGRIVLTTGNKSELAVGYATLYGDMAGGYAPIRDVYKTLVYRLAAWRNRDGEVIPAEVIRRAPSAELAPGQTDQDSLPPYAVLDAILEGWIEDDLTVEQLVARGFERATVIDVVRKVQRNEFKRRQAAPGPMLSRRAFGRDRRYPITSGYRVGD
jgi:NAD+ synthase (glutamine-hydrolysing)